MEVFRNGVEFELHFCAIPPYPDLMLYRKTFENQKQYCTGDEVRLLGMKRVFYSTEDIAIYMGKCQQLCR